MVSKFVKNRKSKPDNRNELMNVSPKAILGALLVGVALFVFLFYILFGISGCFLYDNNFLPTRQEFINSAQWLQAFAVFVTAIVGFYLLNQLRIAANQLKLQQKLAVAEINKRLASKDFSQVRKFLYDKNVQEFFKKEVSAMARSANESNYEQVYSLFKKRFYEFKKYSSEYYYVEIEDIEMLLNEYNLVGMLDRDGAISGEMFTKKAIENAKKMYNVLRSYILLRRAVYSGESEYASDYETWIKKYKSNENSEGGSDSISKKDSG